MDQYSVIQDNKSWNTSFRLFKKQLETPETNLDEIKKLFLNLHSYTHESTSADSKDSLSLEDHLWTGDYDLGAYSAEEKYSGMWHLWHSARVEDICCSHFISGDDEIYDFCNYSFQSFSHTGNSMSLSQMELFNHCICDDEIRDYRQEVAQKTRRAIKHLTPSQLRGKVSLLALARIEDLGSVAPGDAWLLDYWGSKTIAGILSSPLSRHLLVHLNHAMGCEKLPLQSSEET